MKTNDWTQQLHDKLKDHQETVPDHLWDAIDARLHPAPHSLWHRLRWAAAAVLLLAGGALVWWSLQGEDTPARMAHHPIQPSQIQPSQPAAPEAEPAPTTAVPAAQRPLTAMASNTARLTRDTQPSTRNNEQAIVNDRPSTPSDSTSTPNNSLSTQNNQHSTTITPHSTIITQHATQNHSHPALDTQHATILSLYAENIFDDRSQVSPVVMSSEMAQRFTTHHQGGTATARMNDPILLTDYEEQEHHSHPVSVGLKVSYPLSERLAVSTGLVYTRQQSTFTTIMKNNRLQRQQTLHYVGVPVGLQYRLFRWGQLSVYASAGAEADWNLKSDMTTNHIDTAGPEDRCQWSLNGSLGLTYSLLPQVNIFAEPGVRHYLDNHSSVHTYFKEHPTSLGLQVGILLNLGKGRMANSSER